MLALALSEGITLVKKADVDPKVFLEILNSTYFKTGMSEKKAYKMIDGEYNTTFTLSNLKKDISTMTDTARDLGIELPMIKKAEEVYENAIKEGFWRYRLYRNHRIHQKKLTNPIEITNTEK